MSSSAKPAKTFFVNFELPLHQGCLEELSDFIATLHLQSSLKRNLIVRKTGCLLCKYRNRILVGISCLYKTIQTEKIESVSKEKVLFTTTMKEKEKKMMKGAVLLCRRCRCVWVLPGQLLCAIRTAGGQHLFPGGHHWNWPAVRGMECHRLWQVNGTSILISYPVERAFMITYTSQSITNDALFKTKKIFELFSPLSFNSILPYHLEHSTAKALHYALQQKAETFDMKQISLWW